MAWITEGKKSSPSNGTVLADTGQLSAGTYTFKLLATSAIVVGPLLFQQRDSTNTSTVLEQIIDVPVANTAQMDIGGFALGNNERVRVVTNGTILGDIEVSLFYQ